MQGPDGNDSGGNLPKESEQTLKLRAEYARLKEKRAQTDDPDIASVLDMRIVELNAALSEATDPESDEEPEESDEIKKLRAELEKLKDKRSKTKDRNIIAVLDMRIGQIEPTLPPPRKPKPAPKEEATETPEEAFAKIPLPTAAEADAAEKLIKQSMLEKRRGNVVAATDLLKKAAAAAPGSAVVLEALGDDLLERKLTKQARETYKRAHQLDPKNVGLERKFAQSVLQTTMTMSVEDQLRYGMSDSLFLTGKDNVAGIKAAKILSSIFPGVGQMVIGRTVTGIVITSIWVLCFVLLIVWRQDFMDLMHYLFSKNGHAAPNWRVLIPIIGMAIAWIASMIDLSGGGPRQSARQSKVDRPKPPVDLPFD